MACRAQPNLTEPYQNPPNLTHACQADPRLTRPDLTAACHTNPHRCRPHRTLPKLGAPNRALPRPASDNPPAGERSPLRRPVNVPCPAMPYQT